MLSQLAHDEVVFRFESDEDRKEFCQLMEHTSYVYDYVKFEKEGNFFSTSCADIFTITTIPTWTQIKERYGVKKSNKIIFEDGILKCECIFDYENMVNILQSHGYKVEAPYIDPTDEEIIARIKAENEKIGYVANWENHNEKKYHLENYNGTYGVEFLYSHKALGTIYTNQQIAETIVAELNEKRFVRV